MKYRTTLTAKAEILKPNSDEFKAVAASLKDRYGFDLKPQMDLLYVRSCLVSAGNNIGVNDNDDIFTREEAWAARHTPVLKPFNWQHEDKDIVGVMYTVQARSVDGNILDINDNTTPDVDFDLYVEAAIFRLIHEDRAAEIEARSKGGNLFVSMEAWFDDYSYGLYNQEDGQLDRTVARNEKTSFLDKHLRANSGTGVFRDPESNQEMRIGRVLRSITYGGCGFVDCPANKRSVIEVAEPMTSFAEQNTELQIEKLLERVKVLESQGQDVIEEVTLMNTQASNPGPKPEEITAAVDSALNKRDKAAAEAQAKATLEARASQSEQKAQELETQVVALTEAKEVKEAEVAALQSQMGEYGEIVEQLVKDQTVAGATDSTPAEIALIDGASDPFAAKLSWLQKSAAELRVRAARADELETQLAEAEAVVREQEVRSLLSENFSDEAIAVMISRAAGLDEDEYMAWRDEKELMVIEMTSAKKDDKKDKKKLPPFMQKKDDKEDAKANNPFAALLAQRRVDSGMASPDTPTDMGHLINHPGGEGVNSGVTPASPGLSTPRHKIAGSAGDDLTGQLDNAQVEGNVSLAGSQASDDGDSVSAFRVLAGLVTDSEETKDKDQDKTPDFDPTK